MGTPGVKGRRNIWPTSAVPEEGVERKGEVRWGLVEGWNKCFVGCSEDSQLWVTCLVQGGFGASLFVTEVLKAHKDEGGRADELLRAVLL